MKASGRDSFEKRKFSKAKSSAHIIGELVRLRREMHSKNQFSAHISRGGLLDGGVGLVLWFIDEKAKQTESGSFEFYLNSRFAQKLCPRSHKERSITAYLQEAGIIEVVRRGVAGLCNAYYMLNEEWVRILPSDFKLNDWQRKRMDIASLWARNEQYKRRPFLVWVDETIRRTTIPESAELRESLRNPKTKPSAQYVVDFLRDYYSGNLTSSTHAALA